MNHVELPVSPRLGNITYRLNESELKACGLKLCHKAEHYSSWPSLALCIKMSDL